MTQAIPEALKRVAVREDTEQDSAAHIRVDYTGSGDMAHLSINPDLAPPEAVEGYRIRAAIQAALEPLRRYNRAITRRYGSYETEQRLFDDGMSRAAEELEQLVHLTPTVTEAPALAPAQIPAPVADAALPDDFPEVAALRGEGLRTYGAVRDASDEQLLSIPGIGPKRLEVVRAVVSAYYAAPVSDPNSEAEA